MSWQPGSSRGRPRATSEEGEVDEEGEIRSPTPPAPPLPPAPPQALGPPVDQQPPHGSQSTSLVPPPSSSASSIVPPPPPPPPPLNVNSSRSLSMGANVGANSGPSNLSRRSGGWGGGSNLGPSSGPVASSSVPPPPPPLPPHPRAASTGGHHYHPSGGPQPSHHPPHQPHHHHHNHHHHHHNHHNRFEHRHSLGSNVHPSASSSENPISVPSGGPNSNASHPYSGSGPPPPPPPQGPHIPPPPPPAAAGGSGSHFPPPSHVTPGVGRSQSFSGYPSGGGRHGSLLTPSGSSAQQQPQQRPTDPRFRGSVAGEASRALSASNFGSMSQPPYPDPAPGSSSSMTQPSHSSSTSSGVFSSYSMLAESKSHSVSGPTSSTTSDAMHQGGSNIPPHPRHHPQSPMQQQSQQPPSYDGNAPPAPLLRGGSRLPGASSSLHPAPFDSSGSFGGGSSGGPSRTHPLSNPSSDTDYNSNSSIPPSIPPPPPGHLQHIQGGGGFGIPKFRRPGRGGSFMPGGGGGGQAPSGPGPNHSVPGMPSSETPNYYGPKQPPPSQSHPPPSQPPLPPGQVPRHSPTRFYNRGGSGTFRRNTDGMGYDPHTSNVGNFESSTSPGAFEPSSGGSYGHSHRMDASRGGAPPLQGATEAIPPPPLETFSSQQQQHQQSSASDPFGRTREWSTPSGGSVAASAGGGASSSSAVSAPASGMARSSPQQSPKGMRKSMLSLAAEALSGSGPPPPLPIQQQPHNESHRTRPWGGPSGPFGPLKSSSEKSPPPNSAARQSSQHHATAQVDKSHPRTLSTTARPTQAPPPPSLTTRDLGDEATRGETAVKILHDVLPSSKSNKQQETAVNSSDIAAAELPNKQLLFRALAMLDSQIKVAQKQVDARTTEKSRAEESHEQAQAKRSDAVRSEALQHEQERERKEAERQKEREVAHAKAVELKLEERQGELEEAEQLQLQELEAKLATIKQEEENKREQQVNDLITTVSTNYDKDLARKREELKVLQLQIAKVDQKKVGMDSPFEAKISSLTQQGGAGGAGGANNTPDIVSKVLAANRRRAAEANMLAFSCVAQTDPSGTLNGGTHSVSELEALQSTKDPKEGKTHADWAQLAQQVTGLSNALYSEPSEAPYFETNEKIHAVIAPLVKEYIRDKRNRLQQRWTELAEEYEYRREAYNRLVKKRNKGRKQNRSSSVAVRHSILGIKPGVPILESSGGRASTNPYRRARRGNEVRSEYEQEQIIAEIAAKEAMEKKILFGGSKLPRQVGRLERQLTARFVQCFTSQRVDVIAEEQELAITNIWSDTEKCIFLDRFMQHPKDFRKIASFLRNKSTRDCVAFYYNSKQTVPYKAALKEHIMRRKRRGDYHVWDATIDAALSCGATVEVGTSEDKPLIFLLPEHDQTFATYALHPIKREILDGLNIDESMAQSYDEAEEIDEPKRSGQKRKYEPLFHIEQDKRRYIQSASPEAASLKASPSRTSLAETDATEASALDSRGDVGDVNAPLRRAPQKWTNAEKKVFVDTLEKHGRNWSLLAEAVGTKSISQIKNFYYDYKKQSGKIRPDKEVGKKPKPDSAARARKRDEDATTPTPGIQDYHVEARHDSATEAASDEFTLKTPRNFAESQSNDALRYTKTTPQLPPSEDLSSPAASVMRDPDDVVRPSLQRQQSGTATPESLSMAERWIQLQHHNLLSRHQQQQHSQQTVEEAARRLLQQQQQQQHQHHHHRHHHSHHAHHQQILSNLLPWVSGAAGGNTSGGGAGLHPDWAEAAQQLSQSGASATQQLQALLQLRQRQEQQHLAHQQHHHLQQQQQQQQQSHQSNPFASLSAAAQLRARGWDSLTGSTGGGGGGGGLNAAALELALAHQQLQQQQHHQQQQHSSSGESTQLMLAQQLMALHQQGDSSATEALALLQRAMGNSGDGPAGPGH